MIILTLRTDKPEAEIGLYDGTKQLAYETWPAHRQLAESIHSRIEGMLKAQGRQLQDVQALAAYQGPGSFTGLRIGLTVANSLAYARNIPVVATRGDDWTTTAIERLLAGENDTVAMPFYGAEPNITQQKK